MSSCDNAGELKSDDADPNQSRTSGHHRVAGGGRCFDDRTTFNPRREATATFRQDKSKFYLSRGEKGRLAKLPVSQRMKELQAARDRPLSRIRTMLRCYALYEASQNNGFRNMIPIQIHYHVSQVENMLYLQNGRKARLVIAGTNEPKEEGPWRAKRDDLEHLCAKVGVPFVSVPRISKFHEFVRLRNGGNPSSVCGIIVRFNLRNVWDEFDDLKREMARASSLGSFFRQLEQDESIEPAFDQSLKSKRRTLDAEVSKAMKLTIAPLTVDEETTHAPSLADEAVPTEAKKRSIDESTDESSQPILVSLSQPEQAACLPVGDANSDAGRPDHAPLPRDVSSSNDDWRERTDMILSPSDDDVVDSEVEGEERPTKVQKIELHTSATLSKPSSERERHTHSSETLDAALHPESRVQCTSNSFTPSHGSDHTSASKISRLEVEELLLASNIESLAQLARAIDGQIDSCRSKLDDLSSHQAMAESRRIQCHEMVERESDALGTIEASLAQNHVRMAFLLSETLSAPAIYRIREAFEEPSLAPQESPFTCNRENGTAMESSAAAIQLLISPPCDSDDGTALEPGEELVVHQ